MAEWVKPPPAARNLCGIQHREWGAEGGAKTGFGGEKAKIRDLGVEGYWVLYMEFTSYATSIYMERIE